MLGTALTLTESTSKLFGRSVFKLYALYFVEVGTLVVTGVEYGIGAAILMMFAYRHHLLKAVGLRKGELPPRLRFTRRIVAIMAAIGLLNVLGRAFSAFALDSPGMTVALWNGITFGTTLLVFPYDEWRRHRVAAVVVPVGMLAGLAVAAQVWESDASLGGVGWALVGGLCTLLYLPLSRFVLTIGKSQGDQFQALNTLTGAVGLLVWASFAEESLFEGWSWNLFAILALTALLSVIIPRYLHVMARRSIRDGFYAVLSTLSLVIAMGVDYVMEGKVPGAWQLVGLSVVGAVGLMVGYLKWWDDRKRAPQEP